jgi:nucleoside-diphosphate-sugar epimerase
MAGYVSASDVADVMIQLINKRLFSNRYIVIENNYSIQSIFNLIQTQFNKPIPSIKASKFLLQLALIVNVILSKITNKSPLISKSLIQASLNTQVSSNSKILNDLDFTFQPIHQVISFICAQYLRDKTTQTTSG